MLRQYKFFVATVMTAFCMLSSFAIAGTSTATVFNPAIGDFSKYQDYTGHQWKMVLTAYRKDRDRFEVTKYVTRKDGQDVFAGKLWQLTEFLKKNYIEDIDAFCAGRGTIEDLDIANTTLRACKTVFVSSPDTISYWYGAFVPMGILKTEVFNRETGNTYGRVVVSYGRQN